MPRTYPDTPLGWLNEAKDRWDSGLSATGHRMKWRKSGRVTEKTRDSHHYHGKCRKCGGEMQAGEYWATFLAGGGPLVKSGRRPVKCQGTRR